MSAERFDHFSPAVKGNMYVVRTELAQVSGERLIL
jgi:hypothetical protein